MQTEILAGLSVLIVEDELLLRKQIIAKLESLGAEVTAAANLESARRLIAELDFDFALLDVHLPDGRGTDLLKDKTFAAGTGTIVMTANGQVSGAVEAIRAGALDYLIKPFDLDELPLTIARARRARQAVRVSEQRQTQTELTDATFFFGSALAGLQTQLAKILAADQRMQTDLPPVLIQGETGTGKTTIARWLHYQGPRRHQPLIEVNCSALPDTLAESELFGHERGAFTDARQKRMGLFEAAHGGSLFLDELPSLSLSIQAKILSVLEDRRLRRVGSTKAVPVDVRIITATNRDLPALVTAGQFREDLFHRLDLYRVAIPPVRERGPDLASLAELLIRSISRRHKLPERTLSPGAQQKLRRHPWPGNVRELAHELERAIVFEDGAELTLEQLRLPGERQDAPPVSDDDWFNERFIFPEQGFLIEEAIKRMIRHALKQTAGNVSGAARLLGVSRDYVRYRLTDDEAQSLPAGE
jgi:two-component system, NtrC family, response regulator AtoC